VVLNVFSCIKIVIQEMQLWHFCSSGI